MAKIKLNVKCPICGHENPLEILKPSFTSSVFWGHDCKECEAKFKTRFARVPGQPKIIEQHHELVGMTKKTMEIIKEKHPDKVRPLRPDEIQMLRKNDPQSEAESALELEAANESP